MPGLGCGLFSKVPMLRAGAQCGDVRGGTFKKWVLRSTRHVPAGETCATGGSGFLFYNVISPFHMSSP